MTPCQVGWCVALKASDSEYCAVHKKYPSDGYSNFCKKDKDPYQLELLVTYLQEKKMDHDPR